MKNDFNEQMVRHSKIKCEACGGATETSYSACFEAPCIHRCKECGTVKEGEVCCGMPISMNQLMYPEEQR